MTVGELVALLLKHDQTAEVGVAHTRRVYYIQKVEKVMLSEFGDVVIDMSEECIHPDEVDIT